MQVINNSNWQLVETYPQYFAVPRAMTDQELRACMAHRSKGRFPVVTYRHAANGAVMTRSAQPLVGLVQNASIADRKLLDLYRRLGRDPDDER